MSGRYLLIVFFLLQASAVMARQERNGARRTARQSAPTAATSPKKVRFPRGSASVVLEGTVVQGRRDQYVVGARAGQRMTLRVMSIDNGALVKVFGPAKAEPLEGRGEEGTGDWDGQLPASGNYKIVVDSFCERTSYILELTLD